MDATAIRRAYESSAGPAKVTGGGMPPPPTPPIDVDSRTCAARVLSTAVRDARGRVGVLRRSGAADGRARATGPRVVCGLGQKILLAQFFALNSRENCTALSRRERERDYTPPRVTTLACGRLCAF